MRAGYIYRLAGTGKPGDSGNGGLATSAQLTDPAGIAVDQHGNVVFCGCAGRRIMVVPVRSGSFYGLAMKAGHIYAIARMSAKSVAIDLNGNIVLCTGIYGIGNLVSVRATRSGAFYGRAMLAGHVYVVAGGGTQLGDGVPATSALLGQAAATDQAGNLVIADLGRNRLRVVAKTTGTFYGQAMTAGDIYTIAGAGAAGTGDQGPAALARFSYSGPSAVVVTGSGASVVADGVRVREIFAS
jgi:hypothetical protein